MKRIKQQQVPVQRAVYEMDVEEFVFKWKLKIISLSGQVLTDECESPIFYGGERCRFSWRMKWTKHSHLDWYYGTLCVNDLVKSNVTNLELTPRVGYGIRETIVKDVKVAALVTVKDSDAFCTGGKSNRTKGLYFKDMRFPDEIGELRIQDLDPEEGYVVGNSITFTCRVFLQYGENCKLIGTDEKQFAGIESLSVDMKNLLNTTFGDVILRTPTKDFSVHKAILSARSPVFAAMFNSNMLEAKENVVNIDSDDEVLAGMLEHIYTGKSTKLNPKNIDSEKSAELLKLADMYQLPGLKEQSEITLGSFLKIENAGEILVLASMHNASMLKSAVMDFIKRNKWKIGSSKSFQESMRAHSDLLIELFTTDS